MEFLDASRGGAVVLPVSYLMSLHSFELQNLSTSQISSTYLNLQLRYNYFRFGKNVRHIGILLPIVTSCYCASGYQISFKSGYPRRSNDVIYKFKMAAAVAQYSGFVFDDVALIRRSKSIRKPNFVDVS